jgi:hypothetical protein
LLSATYKKSGAPTNRRNASHVSICVLLSWML